MSDSIQKYDYPEAPSLSRQNNQSYTEVVGDIELRNYFRVFIKRKWLVAAVLLSVLSAVALQTFTMVPIYRSTAKVRIDPESSSILPYQEMMASSESYLMTESYLRTQYRILESRALARRVIKRLDLLNRASFNKDPGEGIFFQIVQTLKSVTVLIFSPSREDSKKGQEHVDRFLSHLSISPITRSRLVEVSYDSYDQDFAAEVVNVVVEEFIEQNFESRYESLVRATTFLQKQLEELKIRVESSEEDLIRYARAHNILNIDERESVVSQKLADLNKEMTKVQASLIAKTAFYETIKDTTVSNFPQMLKTELGESLENRLFDLERELVSLSTRFGPEWPDVIELKNQLFKVRDQLSRENERTLQSAQVEYSVALDHYSRLSQALEEQKQLANRLNEDSIQYNILRRETETNKQLYEGLLQRLKEAGVSAGLKSSNIQMLDRGEVPWKTFRPRTVLNLLLGLAVGLLSGVGLAFLVESLDNTLKTPDQVERLLGVPSLGVIPSVRPGEAEELREIAQELTGTGGVALLSETSTGSRVGEAYRSLRTALMLSSSGRHPKTILITSSLSKEGKTTTTANIGVVFSRTGARTLLIDLDMRKPYLSRYFGIKSNKGMSSFLSGNSDLASQISATSFPNLCLLPAGPIPPNPAELIGSLRMQEALKLLSNHFDHIIIDSPPILSVTDALVVSPLVNGVVMVIHGGKTPREAVMKSSGHLEHVGAKILGAIINNVDMQSSEYYYYYRYYYDSAYYTQDQA